MKDFEKLYSPSQWSKRMGPKEIIEHHVNYVREVSNRTRRNIPSELDVEYGFSERQKLDIFGTDLPKDAPIFIYIHGGYWQMLERQVSSYMVEPLHKNGFKVIVIGYNLCPQVTLPEIIEEVQKAFSYCINYAKRHQSRGLYIGGHSAGAHLTSSLFTGFFTTLPQEDQNLLKEVFLISGVYDLIPLIHTSVNLPLKLNASEAKRVSPMHQVISTDNKDVVFNVIVGEDESPAFVEQSRKFARIIKASRIKSEFVLIKDRDHFNIVEDLNKEDYTVIKMLIRNNKRVI